MKAYIKDTWLVWLAIAFGVLMVVIGGGCAEIQRTDDGRQEADGTVAFEGELDPNELAGWPEVAGTRTLVTVGLGAVTIQNPDPKGAVQRVRAYVLIRRDGGDILTAYKYFKDGMPWFYKLDFESNRYVNDPYSKEDVRACMECHCDRIKGCKKGTEV